MHRAAPVSTPKSARVYPTGLPIVLAVYTLAALFLTWPLVRHFTTHVPGDGIDDPSLAWNLWWLKTRLVDQVNLDIFHADWMFHPIEINLGFYTLTPLNGLLSVPLQTAFTLVTASNLILLSSFVLGGFGAYLLTLQELKQQSSTAAGLSLAALCAGFLYAFASSKLFYVSLGQFNIASSQWIPFCALYLLRLGRVTTWRAGVRNALLAALFLTLQAWAELTYASFLIVFAALVFLWSLFTRTGQLATRHSQFAIRITTFTLLALGFLLGITPFLWAMLPDLWREGDFFASGGGFADEFSADLMGYLLPTELHPFFGDWVSTLPFPHTLGQQIFLGYSVMILAMLGGVAALRQSTTRGHGSFWIVATLLFWWLTLGAHLRWLGEALSIPGPFALISRLPFFSGNRYPSRYSVMLLLCVAVLAAIGVARLLARRQLRAPYGQWGLAAGLIVLLLVEHLSIPLPLSDFRIPPIYQRLAAEPGDFAVLELPTGWRNGARVLGKSDILIMMQQWYQTTHGKRRLGGNTSRNPPYKFQYFTQAPLIGDLIGLMNAEAQSNPANAEIARVVAGELDTLIARNRPLASQVLTFLDIRYVTVHVEKSPPALLRFVNEALPLTLMDEWQGTDWSGAASTIRLYGVEATSATNWSSDLAAPAGQLHLGEGWSTLAANGLRYATRPCAELLFNLPDSGGNLTLTLAGPPHNVTISLNGRQIGTATLSPQGTDTTVSIPRDWATALIDRVQLCFAQRTPLADLDMPPTPQGWPIGNTGSFIKPNLVVQSAGKDVGDFAHIWVDGVDVAAHLPGYNLVALASDGAVQASRAFSTFSSTTESQAMADWLQQWPVGTIIVGAVQDEASSNLSEQAILALNRLGVATDLRSHFRWSHALIGVVGAPPASALEASSLLQPASVYVGSPVDAPAVYGAVGPIHFTANP